MESHQLEYFDEKYIFDFSMGLNIAAAFTDYGDNEEVILDKSIGEL